jgi:DNA-binding CsgD family transcriptional regulator
MSFADDVLALIGHIYDAGVEPGLWDSALMRLGERFGANGGILMTTAGASNRLSFASEFGATPEWQALYNREYHKPALNPLFPAFRQLQPGIAAADWMLLPKPDLMRSPFYNEWSLPQDRHAYVGLLTSRGPRTVGGIMFSRGRRRADFGREEVALLQVLAPHLVRAVGLSRHLGVMAGQRRLCDALLDSAAGPLVVVDMDGRIVLANHAAWRILDSGDALLLRHDRLTAVRPAETSLLRRRIRSVAEHDLAAREALAVTRRSGGRPYGVVATSVPAEAAGWMPGRRLVAVFIADPDAAPPDMATGLRAAFGFTPAETALVVLLARDAPSLAEAADRLGVSRTTVKTHLRHCFEKAGVRRQTELVRLALAMAGGLPRRDC